MADPSHSPASTVAVRLKGITKSFSEGGGSSIMVLKGIDLEAHAGEILMLVGPSGCGKTTLLSVIAGTLNINSGEVEVFGERLDKIRPAAITKFRAMNIGFIFQQFNLIPTLNLAENVSVPLLIQGMSNGKAEKKAKEQLDRVGLGDRWRARPTQLSGGEQQRVAIARSLVHDPRLIICDEPTASLDAKNGTLVMDLFESVARLPGRAVIVVTHDYRIFNHADRIAKMDDGLILDIHEQKRTPGPPVPQP